MVQVVLPNDANPMGFMLGGAVMHLIDIAAAVTAFRHARSLMVTAASSRTCRASVTAPRSSRTRATTRT